MANALLTRPGDPRVAASAGSPARPWARGRWWLAAAALATLAVTVRDVTDPDAYWRLARNIIVW